MGRVLQNALKMGQETRQGNSANIAFLAKRLEPLVNMAESLLHALLPETETGRARVEELLTRLSQPHYAKQATTYYCSRACNTRVPTRHNSCTISPLLTCPSFPNSRRQRSSSSLELKQIWACWSSSQNSSKLRVWPAMCLSSRRSSCWKAALCQLATIDISQYYCSLIKVLQKSMNATPSTPKELADTSASFFHAPNFQYRSQETAIDFVLMRDRQKQRVLDAFRGDSTFNQERLIAELERVQEESNQFIQSLLQELADQCKRNRMIQAEFDSTIRDKNTEARRLAEKSLDVAAKAQVDRNRWEQERGSLQREAKQAQQALKSMFKECQGLRQLLQEYQNQLQTANAKIEELFQESTLGTHMIGMMTDKLEKLTLQLSECKEQHQSSIEQIESLRQQLLSSQHDNQRVYNTLCHYKEVEERNQALQQQCNQLKEKHLGQTEMLEYLERKLLQTNGQVVRQQNKCLSIQASSSMDIQKLINRENQREITLQAVEAKAKLGMSKLKESYERKMRKIVAYFQMEVRDIKSSCNSMKENIQKQMLIFFKLTQRDIRERQMTLKEKNKGKEATVDRKRSRCILEPMLQN